jgi:hypothetical protein
LLKWITPSLAVAVDWPDEDILDSADDATGQIQQGGVAFVQDDTIAAAVLHNLGLSDEEIADRLHFADTGRVL